MAQAYHQGEYPSDWPEIARRVKDEAGWRCVRCKHVHAPQLGRTLTVHHFDGNKGNCARWNLMALCQACHLSVQARVDPANPLLWEPSPWAMPYIAGYYEAGMGVPGPLYELAQWLDLYEREVGPWPTWAVTPEVIHDLPKPQWEVQGE